MLSSSLIGLEQLSAQLDSSVFKDKSRPFRDRFASFVCHLQVSICQGLLACEQTLEHNGRIITHPQNSPILNSIHDEPGTFQVDQWQRNEGGYGISSVLQNGRVFEKAGVNVSVVHGQLTPAAVQHMRSRGRLGTDIPDGNVGFFASGISIVIHAHDPNVPTVHLNYRYFELETTLQISWFGGGSDLTPVYLFEEDAQHFHQTLKDACDPFDSSFYPRFKKWADSYFFLPHRQEHRGVGGIFFDDLDGLTESQWTDFNAEMRREAIFEFVQSCGAAFLPSYVPIVQKRHGTSPQYTNNPLLWQQRHQWKQVRRGRYVEFNLLEDRGTKFGLASQGRIESILVSMPLQAQWIYDYRVVPDSEEDKISQVLRTPREWI